MKIGKRSVVVLLIVSVVLFVAELIVGLSTDLLSETKGAAATAVALLPAASILFCSWLLFTPRGKRVLVPAQTESPTSTPPSGFFRAVAVGLASLTLAFGLFLLSLLAALFVSGAGAALWVAQHLVSIVIALGVAVAPFVILRLK
ncbi:MAG: hypothetical protein ACREVR_10830 [Burkholderiales bacterium]